MRNFAVLITSAVLLSALLLTACGSDGGDGNGGTDAITGQDTPVPPRDEQTPPADVETPPVCQCGARVCGPHPDPTCDLNCGTCPTGERCTATGICEADPCTCTGLECGTPAGCTDTNVQCGTCPADKPNCTAANLCSACTPNCGDRQCGVDPVCSEPCGDNGGDCTGTQICNAQGMCEECTPQCGTRECGPSPNCPGVPCGECTGGETCNAQGVCEPPAVVSGFGGSCLQNSQCHDELSTGEAATPNFPDCTNELCEDGLCFGVWCTKPCTPEKDAVNNVTGAAMPDGIEDADSPSTQCEGADTTFFDGTWRCVNISTPGETPRGFCSPGSDFRPCAANADCAAGEGCQIQYVQGALSTFCAASVKENLVGISDQCNSNPLEGDLAFCASDLCFSSLGCSAFCQTDNDCATFDQGCDVAAGHCTDDPQIPCTQDADCSAWRCEFDQQIYSNDPTPFDICFGKNCVDNAACGDSDFSCDLMGNGTEGMDFAEFSWVNICVARPAGWVNVGEECDPDPTDNIPGPPCASEGWCFGSPETGGYCSGLCTSDADCAADMRCVIEEVDVDLDDDGTLEGIEPIGYCVRFDDPQGTCHSEADCAEGYSCTIYEGGDYSAGNGQQYITGTCTKDADDAAGYLEQCGLEGMADCAGAGWLTNCFGVEDVGPAPQAGYCSVVCHTSADCPVVEISADETYKGMCNSYYFAENGTLDDLPDDLFVNYCEPIGGDSSLADCSATKACEEATETCFPNQLFGNPTEPSVVEYLCIELGEDPPTAEYGAACDPNPAEGEGTVCKSLICNAEGDETDPNNHTGYCGKLCNTDADCAGVMGAVCQPEVLFDRPGDENDLVLPNCVKPAAAK